MPNGSLTVTGVRSGSSFTSNSILAGGVLVFCNEKAFRTLTGGSGYIEYGIQLVRSATGEDAGSIAVQLGTSCSFSDRRDSNTEKRANILPQMHSSTASREIITLITALGIVNCMAMSVSARTKQYGIRRAVGMTGRQLKQMATAEAAACAAGDCILGLVLGPPMHYWIFNFLVTQKWGTAWELPAKPLCVILRFTAVSALLAVRCPVRRLREMSVTDTLAAL